MSKAILIDVTNKTVTNCEINHYKEIYPLIGNGCTMFTVPVELENMDAIYVDDEGLLHDEMKGGFILEGYHSPLIGNAVIQGTDDEGESVDCKSTLEEIAARITFLTPEQSEQWRNHALNQPTIIFTTIKE